MHEMFELLLIVDLHSQLIYCSEPFDVFILTIPSNSRLLLYLNLGSESGYCIMFEIHSTQHPKVVKGQSAKFQQRWRDNYGTLGDESEGDCRYHGSSRSDISRDSVGASCALTQGSMGSPCTCDGCNSDSDAMRAATYGGSIDEGCNDYGCGRSGGGVICVAPRRGTSLQICHRGVDESGDVMYIVPREPTGSTCNGSCGEGGPGGTMSAVASGKSTDCGRGNEGGEGARRTVTSDWPQGPGGTICTVSIGGYSVLAYGSAERNGDSATRPVTSGGCIGSTCESGGEGALHVLNSGIPPAWSAMTEAAGEVALQCAR